MNGVSNKSAHMHFRSASSLQGMSKLYKHPLAFASSLHRAHYILAQLHKHFVFKLREASRRSVGSPVCWLNRTLGCQVSPFKFVRIELRLSSSGLCGFDCMDYLLHSAGKGLRLPKCASSNALQLLDY